MKDIIQVGSLVLPYNKNQPIKTFENPKGDSLIVRARMHDSIKGMWYSNVNPEGEVVAVGEAHGIGGCIIFVSRVLKIGEGVLIEKVFPAGRSAKGSPVLLPDDWTCPMEVDFSQLAKSTEKVI